MWINARTCLRALPLVVAIAMPRAASADPVTLTGGFLEAALSFPAARGVFEGPGFLMTFGVDGFFAPVALCRPCAPGADVHLGGVFNFTRAGGPATVDGVSYPHVFFDGMTGTFVSPSFQLTGTERTTLTQPFSFTGQVSGYLINPFISGFTDPAFTKSLSGHGIATATFSYLDVPETGPQFDVVNLRYDFTADAPVPEPGTLVLCGAGLGLLAARRRRANGAAAPPPPV